MTYLILKKKDSSEACLQALTEVAASLSTGAAILLVLWAAAVPKQARQGLHRAGRVQPYSKVSLIRQVDFYF